MSGNSVWVLIPVIGILAMVIKTWIRAHYGIAGPFDKRNRWDSSPENMAVPPMFQKLMEKAMKERDEEIGRLRERIEVLERIVTDGHKGSSLADEIERLREKA